MFSFFGKLIEAELVYFLAFPGSVKILRNGPCTGEIVEKIGSLGVKKIILVGHSDCLAYKKSSRERQHADMRYAVNFCTANFRNADIYAIWAEIEEKGSVRLTKMTFREKTISFSPVINLSDI